MSMKYLGEQFAMHSGGIDHVPVHHPNEIAQAENATGKRPFVLHWVHYNFLRIDGQKMSKSLNNYLTLDDIVNKGMSPMAFKLLLLGSHYRDELNFTWESMAAAQKGWERLVRRVASLPTTTEFAVASLRPEARAWHETMRGHLENDLKTAQALATFWTIVKQADTADAPLIHHWLRDRFGLYID